MKLKIVNFDNVINNNQACPIGFRSVDTYTIKL